MSEITKINGYIIKDEQARQDLTKKADKSSVYTKGETSNLVDEKIVGKADKVNTYTKEETNTKIKEEISKAQLQGSNVDLSNYVTKQEIPTRVSQLTNDSGFLTEHQDISHKADINDVYTQIQTDNKISEAISKIELKEGPQGPKGEQGETGADGLTTSITVNGETYTHVDGTITLPDYPESIEGSNNASDIAIKDANNNFKSENVEDALSEVSSQIKDIANNAESDTFDDCIYNMSALKNINNREFFSMVVLGDSIGAGTAAANNYGFIQRFVNTANYRQGFVKYGVEYFYYKEIGGWTREETGISLQTISSTNTSVEIYAIPNQPWSIPTNEYKAAIVYCKKTDGGQFDVKDSDDNILATIDCSGENNLGCISDYFTVGAGKAFKICPKQDNKAYVIAAMIDYQPEKKGYKIVNWSVGGRQLCDYTKEEISTMILYDSFDTVYCELFANDSAMGKFDEYFDKLTYLIDTAKANKKDVILNITNRNQDYDSTEDTRANFKNWENKMYEIAKEKNCCLINYDRLIGGHTIGKANGLIADTIHPTELGHEVMAKLLNFVIFKDRNTYAPNLDNTTYPIYGKRQNNDEQYYEKTQYFNDIKIRIWDNNGNKNGAAPVMPIIRHWAGPQAFTKFAEEGALGSVGRLLYINQNNINTQANWKLVLTSPFLETVTSIPSVNDDNKNTIFRYRQEGKDDQIIVCVKVGGIEQFKAIQLIDII